MALPVVLATRPEGQAGHPVAPVPDWARPRGQFRQEGPWAGEGAYLPAKQFLQEEAPLVSLNLPEGQLEHDQPPGGVYVPYGHKVHDVEPTDVVVLPEGHRVHDERADAVL